MCFKGLVNTNRSRRFLNFCYNDRDSGVVPARAEPQHTVQQSFKLSIA